MPNFLVNTDTKLHNIIDDLQKSPIMGLDTEFIRESTYFPQLALLQLSDKNNTYCIDILAITENNLISDELQDSPNVPFVSQEKISSGECLAKGGELINPNLISCSDDKEIIKLIDEVNKDYVCCI